MTWVPALAASRRRRSVAGMSGVLKDTLRQAATAKLLIALTIFKFDSPFPGT
jgi:hypothetical protein